MRRWLASIVPALAITFAAGRLFGAVALVYPGALSFPIVVGRHDNDAGTCLPLAVLFILALVMIALVVVSRRVMHPF